jgi:phosphatidylglycerol:prolipoprotein diacylglycerol transferase
MGVLAGVILTHRRLARRGDGLLDRPGLIFGLLLGGFLGSRLHYVIESVLFGNLTWREGLSSALTARGGSTFLGAVAGILLAVYLLRRHLPRVGPGRFGDCAVWGIAIAVAVGRIGCLVQGCCVGRECDLPWGLPLPLDHPFARGSYLEVHPFPLYLGGWSLLSAALAHRGGGSRPGDTFLLFAFLFAGGRFLLEFLRWPTETLVGLGVAQWESLALFLALGLVIVLRRRSVVDPEPEK